MTIISYIKEHFSEGRVITVLVHTYIATIIYEVINPLIFLIIDPSDKLKTLKFNIKNKEINIGRVLSELITVLLILAGLYYLHRNEMK